MMRAKVLPLVCLAALACGAPAEDSSSMADQAVMTGPRVPRAPTAPGAMPPAIVGDGGALQGIDLAYFDADSATLGYLAVPEGPGPFPALVIIHEWNGLVDRVREVADDFAAEGYVTLAADLYAGETGSTPDGNIALMNAANADMTTVIANLDAAVAYLRGRSDVTGRVGAMGWCFGGGIALSFGLDGVDHDATAIFYGRLIDDPAVLAHLDHEVYGTFAALDGGIPPASVEAFAAALQSAGIENDVHVYDDVNHGFWLRVDPSVEAQRSAGIDAWTRLKAYLDRTLRE